MYRIELNGLAARLDAIEKTLDYNFGGRYIADDSWRDVGSGPSRAPGRDPDYNALWHKVRRQRLVVCLLQDQLDDFIEHSAVMEKILG